MKIYHAGTAETNDLLTTLIVLAVFFGLVALISRGIPWFRDYLHARRMARMALDESADVAGDGDEEQDRLHMHTAVGS